VAALEATPTVVEAEAAPEPVPEPAKALAPEEPRTLAMPELPALFAGFKAKIDGALQQIKAIIPEKPVVEEAEVKPEEEEEPLAAVTTAAEVSPPVGASYAASVEERLADRQAWIAQWRESQKKSAASD
jgi:hypothetical protein